MPLRIAVTLCDCSAVLHVGGDVTRKTSIIELSDDQIPAMLKSHFEFVASAKEHNMQVYETVSLSIVE